MIWIWLFSCVLAWAFVGSSTSAGETVQPAAYRKLIRVIAFWVSAIALLSTMALISTFFIAFSKTNLLYFTGPATYLFVWTAIHLSGATFNVLRIGKQIIANAI